MLSRTTPAIALAVLTCAGALAQELHVVSGRAVDARGVAVPAATIRLSSGGAGPEVETLTELDGSFSFTNLPAATYRITAEMAGFREIAVDVDAASDASRALVLRFERAVPPPPRAAEAPPATAPANSAGAPAAEEPSGRSPQPNSRRGAPEGAAPSARFQEVGVLNASGGDALASAAPEEPAAQRPEGDVLLISGSSGATIDMGDFADPQFRERMAEMAGRMGFGGFRSDEGGDGGGAREFGGFGVRFAGGGGFGPGGGPGGGDRGGFGGRGGRGAQPRLNGSIQATYRNSALNARPYSITGNEVAKPLQIGNNFGASFGGPLPWGPKSSGSTGRGRIAQQAGMWFFSYEGSRNRNPYDALTTVPTELERTGDFSQTSLRAGPLAGRVVDLYDPLTGAPFPEGRIPASRIDPVASALLGYVPPPNLPGAVQNFTLQRGLLGTSDSFSARFATRLSTKHNIFASYSLRTSDGISSQHFLGLDTDRATRSQNGMLGGMVRFQPRLIANYRVTFNRVRSLSSNPFAFVDDVAGKLGITGVSREPINYGIPTINFTNYGDLQLGSPSLTRTQTFGVGGGMNKIGTKHSIQIGAGFNRNQRNSQIDPNARGTFDFTGFATSAFDDRGRPVSGTGHDLADFLLGLPYSTSRRFGSANNYLRNTSLNLFAQDNWRLRSNLTVNFGLRYEYNGPYYEKYDRMVTLDPAPGFTAVAQAFPDTQGAYSGHFPRSLVRPDRNNFGPRIGIAWKPKATSRWVFRTGYGLFYNPSVYSTIASQLVGQPPFAVSQNILTSLEQPLTMANGFPTDPEVTILNSYAIDPDYRIGYVQQWNLNLQTQVRRLYTVEVGYNGTKGTRLDILRAPNRAPAGSSPGDTEGNRTISNAGNFVYQGSGANSILHSLRVRANRRFSRGFRIENSYTLGKSIDNASGIGGGGLVVVQDERNIAGERSRSSFDRRHRFESELNIDLPFGARRRFLAGARPLVQGLVGGWSLNGDYELFSGTPLTARILGNQSNNSGTGSSGSERPDATGAAVALSGGERTTSRFFNTAAFALPAAGRFGNAGRYTISGPGTNLLDLSLRKSFRLDDNNRRVELRWSVENVLNHPNFGGVGTVVNALNFGRVTSARSMRQMVFNLRITF